MCLQEDWPEGYQLAAAMNFRFPQCVQVPFRQVIPNASNDGLQVLRDMLLWNPQKRPSSPQVSRGPRVFTQNLTQVTLVARDVRLGLKFG